MKSFIAVSLLAAICAVVKSEDVCHDKVMNACSPTGFFDKSVCDSRYGGVDHFESETQALIRSYLTKSYEYMFLGTYYNSYQKNRPGFQKLYQGLSDRTFDDAIDIIRQLSRRGGVVDFNVVHESPATIVKQPLRLEVNELHSLAIALDTEKQLAEGTIHVHNRCMHAIPRDPEMAHYIEEKFLGKQAASIRQLAGYANDLAKLMNQKDPSLAVYLFDKYLQD